jgi:DNA-binding SARP family transcriptional activator/DNA-binding beta-propeller fold protein YncE
MEFRILGTVDVLDDGRPLTIRRGKEQALLAYLLLHANELVPSARLIDVLWDERPPATAPKVLQNAVSNLRKQLGDSRLETRDRSYLLRVADDEFDLMRFRKLASEGKSAEALALWRGTPLIDLYEEPFADDARRRLEDERLSVLEERIDADLAGGGASNLIPELESLVTEHPLRERFYGQLMLAYYRAGRQSDALETFRRARRTLSDEVGLEPGPQLQELERKILQQDRDLVAAPQAARPPSRPRRWPLLVALVVALVAAAIAYAVTRDGGEDLTIVPNSVVRIDPQTDRVTAVVPVGRRPAAVVQIGRNLWVANSLDDTLTHIDTRSFATRALGGFTFPTSLVQERQRLWVGNNSRGVLVALDPVSGGVLDRVRIKGAAAASSLGYGADSIWVSEEEAAVHRVSLATQTTTMRLPDTNVHQVAYGLGAAWAVVVGLRQLVRIDPQTGRTSRFSVGSLPTGIAVGFGAVWVASSGDDTVWRIDPEVGDVKDVVHVGKEPEGVAVVAGSVWVANNAAGTVSRIDPDTDEVVAVIRTGYAPLAIGGSGDEVWVAVAGAPEP